MKLFDVLRYMLGHISLIEVSSVPILSPEITRTYNKRSLVNANKILR